MAFDAKYATYLFLELSFQFRDISPSPTAVIIILLLLLLRKSTALLAEDGFSCPHNLFPVTLCLPVGPVVLDVFMELGEHARKAATPRDPLSVCKSGSVL
jgi:hypothetical protein